MQSICMALFRINDALANNEDGQFSKFLIGCSMTSVSIAVPAHRTDDITIR